MQKCVVTINCMSLPRLNLIVHAVFCTQKFNLLFIDEILRLSQRSMNQIKPSNKRSYCASRFYINYIFLYYVEFTCNLDLKLMCAPVLFIYCGSDSIILLPAN